MKLILVSADLEKKDARWVLRLAEGRQFLTHNAKLWAVKSLKGKWCLAREPKPLLDDHLEILDIPTSRVYLLDELKDILDKKKGVR